MHLLVWQFHPTPGSKRSSQLHKMYHSRCMAKNSWWWAERLSETCRVVIPIRLEFSASVGLVQKESVTMHGHTILKCLVSVSKITKLTKTANIHTHTHTHKSPRNAPSGFIFISQAFLLFKNAQQSHLQPQLVDALKISIKRSSGKWALTVPLAGEKRRPFFSDFWQCLLNLIEVQ